ncbi:MAG: class I SAM-dependent methyltransferase [Dongiaceae bacterium]
MNADDNLEEFTDPELYDREFGSWEPEGPFFETIARDQGGPVIDIGCGTGWLAIPLAKAGVAVTGVDIMQPMIERARAKSAGLPIRWIVADARDLALGERFALATMTSHAFQSFLTDADHAALLRNVHTHLEPNGLFAFDTRNPRRADIDVDGRETFWHSFADGEGRSVDVYLREHWDAATGILDCHIARRWRDGSRPEQQKRIRIRYIGADALRARLESAGFRVEAQYGNWDRSPVTEDSPEIITLARRL